MRRPLLMPCIFLSAGIAIQFYLKLSLLTISVSALILFLIFAAINKFAMYRCLWLAAGMFLLFNCSCQLESMEEDIGKETELTGVCRFVSKEKGLYDSEKYEFILIVDKDTKIKVSYYESEKDKDLDLIGRQVTVKGVLEKPQSRRNPNCFDYSLYLKSKGIGYQMKADEIVSYGKVDGIWNGFLRNICNLRDDFSIALSKVMGGENAGILKAMMFGIKDEMKEETYSEFQKNGTAHLLAVSGLHMGIIYALISKMFGARKRIIPNTAVVLLLFCYMTMADFTASITRAFIMIVISIFGKMYYKRYDLMSAGLFAAMMLLVKNPYNLFNGGFQMSFLAIFIMASVMTRTANININPFVKNSVLPVFAIQGAMSVYISYNFNYFSVTSFIANIPVALIASWLLPMGIIALIFFAAVGDIPKFYGNLMETVTVLMKKLNAYTYADGVGTFDVTSPTIFFVILFYGLFFMVLNEELMIAFVRKQYKRICISVFALMVFGVFTAAADKDGFEKADVIFFDVGQGNCTLFRTEDGKNILVDAGGNINYDIGEKTVKPALLKNGIRKIDIAFVTHLDNDHYLGIKSLAQKGMIERIAFYEGNNIISERLSQECGISKKRFLFLKKGDVVDLGEGLSAEIIAPERKNKQRYQKEYDEGDENKRSLVIRIIKDKTVFLITGDIDKKTEETIEGNIKADVIQVPHHGSGGSSGEKFIERVKPKAAVFQVGKNNYGHPDPDVIEKYKNKCIIINRNDENGAVGFNISDGNFHIVTMIDGKDR